MAEHEKTNDPYLAANPGHEDTIHQWAESEAGKEFAKGSKDRDAKEKAAAEAQEDVDANRPKPTSPNVEAKEEAASEEPKNEAPKDSPAKGTSAKKS